MDREFTLRITLEKPTAGVDFGLQKGHGSNYETVQTQRSEGKDLSFECSVRVARAKDGLPNFLGPFAQGPVGQKFIYIDNVRGTNSYMLEQTFENTVLRNYLGDDRCGKEVGDSRTRHG